MVRERELPDYGDAIYPVSVACQKREAGRRVALLRCTQNEDLKEKSREVLSLLGGLGSVIEEGDRVFVKVNGTMARPRSDGAVVDVRVLWAVVEEAYAAGSSEVAVGDAAVLEQGGTLHIFEHLGYKEMAESTGARLIDLNLPPFARVRVPGGGLAYRSLLVREELRAYDVVLNVAKMKNHSAGGVTLGLKNMFGMTPMNPIMGFTKNSFHGTVPEKELVEDTPQDELARQYASEFLRSRPSGQSHDKLARAIVDHNLTFPSSLVVIDGVIGMEGDGPWNGEPIQANVLVAGCDLLATDVVAAHLMGYDPECIPLFWYASEAGLGELDLSSVQLVGDDLEKLSVPFKRHAGFDAWSREWLRARQIRSPE
jgi:uncharacterized protein (DUF362 family)